MRRVRRKGGNKEKVFGCDLLEHLNASSQEVPQVLRCCSEFVETHGIVDGIYRLSGVSSNIQKLRGEFEGDGSPDLNKDVFLQDIHCVSSLCKAYFRELPNPLLTYQLYDKFAEAVAIQLEEERLVKIRDVLKELPQQHYKTLEFLMRHLVKMASFSSETNMHARNLAIVWAPNLLRSKDIEASGFNGTAVFKEVRVQSIVVEFILTHVPQLFPEQGVSGERRKSLPSPTASPNQEEGLFKSSPITNIGNISPGAGPLLMRPYHAVIEGTDKRKGSLKGRKWMSIFNIGGRFQDQRRRMKNSAKEKDRPALRPARSMDSLSAASYPNEGLRRGGQRPPPTDTPAMSPLATSASQSGSDASIFSGNLSGSEYAVTYRRGTGCVGSGAGVQGTYTALDPEGSGAVSNESLQSRSPGHSTKVGRRAAMHITGPTLVTVPLHITSNLALGVLQGGGGTRVIHRSRDKDGGDRLEVKEGQEQAERRKTREIEWDVKKEPEEEGEKGHTGQGVGVDGIRDNGEASVAGGSSEEGVEGEKREQKGEEEEEKEEEKEEMLARDGEGAREQRIKSLTSDTEEENTEGVNEAMDHHVDDCITKEEPGDLQTEVTEASSTLDSTAVEGDDQGLSGYVQDNFDFLDQMDCSVLDHMELYSSYQVNEFSVEPPGHSDDEYEVMNEAQFPRNPADGVFESTPQRGPSNHPADDEYEKMRRRSSSIPTGDEHELAEQATPHRLLLSGDASARHVKSLSLPYMTSPVHGPEECSEDECQWVNSDDSNDSDDSDYNNDYDSDGDQDMCTKSLPFDYFFPPDRERDAGKQGNRKCDLHQEHQQLQISAGPSTEFPQCGEECADDQRQAEVEKDGGGIGLEMSTGTGENANERDGQADSEQSIEANLTEEEEDTSVKNTQMYEDEDTLDGKEDKETVPESLSDDSVFHAQKDATSSSLVDSPELSLDTPEEPRHFTKNSGKEDACEADPPNHERDSAVDEHARESISEDNTRNPNSLGAEEKVPQESDELDGANRRTSSDIWDELEDVVCEVIEEEESKQAEKRKEIESVSDQLWDSSVTRAEEADKRMAVMFEEAMIEVDGGQMESEVRLEITEDTEDLGTTEGNASNEGRDQQFEENSMKAKESDDGVSNKTQLHHCEGLVFKGENKEEQKSMNLGLQAVRSDVTEPKEGASVENTDSNQGGVGSKLVAFKNPKIHQVKAVPVVPPKPQHCRITALALRQQQKERRDPDKSGDNLTRGPTEQGTVCGEPGKDWSCSGTKERAALRGEDADRDQTAARDSRRNSPLSMCFDEAVAKATMRREKEKEHEKERQREWGSEVP